MDGDEPGAERFFVFVGGMRNGNQGLDSRRKIYSCKMVDVAIGKAYGK
jgi:hypothetical protein